MCDCDVVGLMQTLCTWVGGHRFIDGVGRYFRIREGALSLRGVSQAVHLPHIGFLPSAR